MNILCLSSCMFDVIPKKQHKKNKSVNAIIIDATNC